MEFIKKFWNKYRQIIVYFAYGAGTTIFNLLIYTVLISLGASITAANGVAWLGAVIFAFVTNKIFVFESRCWAWKTTLKEAGKFLGARFFSGLVEIFLPTLLFYLGLDHDLFGIEGFFAKIIVSVIVIILNYVVSKMIVFRKK